MKIHYNPKLKYHARELRKKGVLSEVLLWNHLKGRKMRGYQFMRQKPVGDYIVDFFCTTPFIPPLLRGTEGVVIEIDGESHDGRFLYDMVQFGSIRPIRGTPYLFSQFGGHHTYFQFEFSKAFPEYPRKRDRINPRLVDAFVNPLHMSFPLEFGSQLLP